jgi:hypothetical protein
MLRLGKYKDEYDGYDQQNFETFAIPAKERAVSDYPEMKAALIIVFLMSLVVTVFLKNPGVMFFDHFLWAIPTIAAAMALIVHMATDRKILFWLFIVGLAMIWVECKFFVNLFTY